MPKANQSLIERLKELPLCTLGLALLLLIAFLVTQFVYGSRLEHARQSLNKAILFSNKNPTLEMDARFRPVVESAIIGFEADDTFAFLNETREDDPEIIGPTKQEELNELIVMAFENLDHHPHRVLGIAPAQRPMLGYLTYSLIHPTWVYCFATLFLLLFLGPPLEIIWGRGFFSAALLFMSLTGGAAYGLTHLGSDRALLGSATLVAGLTGATLIRFRGREFAPLDWLRPFLDIELRIPFWSIAIPAAIYEVLLYWATRGGLPIGIEHTPGYSAHLASAIVGASTAFAIQHFKLEQRYGAPPPEPVAEAKESAAFDLRKILKLRDQGEDAIAFSMLLEETRENARNRDVVMLLWEMALERKEPERAAIALRNLIQEELRRGSPERAVSHWGKLAKYVPNSLLEPSELVRLLPTIQSEGGDKFALLALKQALHTSNAKHLSTELTVQIAKLASKLDPKVSVSAAQRALDAEDLTEAVRSEVEALLDQLVPNRKTEQPASSPEADVEPPPAPFYEEEDRSMFGETADLSDIKKQPQAPQNAPPVNPEVQYVDPVPVSPTPTVEAAPPRPTLPPQPPQISSYGMDPVVFDTTLVGNASNETGVNLDHELEAMTSTAQPAAAQAPRPQSESAKTVPQIVEPENKPQAMSTPDVASDPPPLFQTALVKEVLPVELDTDALVVQIGGQKPSRLAYERIQAVSLAAVKGLGASEKPVITIDLLLNWQVPAQQTLQIVRLRSDQFDPRKLVANPESPLEAVLRIVHTVQERSKSELLNPPQAPGTIPTFESVASYFSRVLRVESV